MEEFAKERAENSQLLGLLQVVGEDIPLLSLMRRASKIVLDDAIVVGGVAR